MRLYRKKRIIEKNKEPKSGGNKNAKELLDKSSEINRNLGLAFVGFLTYILVTTNGISDLQLLLLDKGVQLPIVGIILPLIPFARVAPLLIVGIHLNLLLNLREHASKLNHWLQTESENEGHNSETSIQKQLHPFLFNYVHSNGGSIFLFLTKLIVNVFTYFVPLLCLFYVQYRFSDLHDFGLSLLHFICFSIDALLVILCYTELLSKERVTWRKYLSHGLFPIRFVYFSIQLFKTRSLSGFFKKMSLIRLLDQTLFWSICFLAISYILVVWLISSNWVVLIAYRNGRSFQDIAKRVLDPSPIPDYYKFQIDLARRKFPSIPNIEVYGEKMAVFRPSLNEILLGRQNFYTEDSLVVKYTKGLNLANRDLKFARIVNCDLINSDLSRASLQKAVISFSNLQNANLSNSMLSFAYIYETQLQNADISGSNLLLARIVYSSFNKADLRYAFLTETTLSESNFKYADLIKADLGSSKLYMTNLQYANLEQANFINAQTSMSNFTNAEISHANFKDAQFSSDTVTNIIGADKAIAFPVERIKKASTGGRLYEILEK